MGDEHGRGEEADQLTLVEIVEEVLLGLAGTDPATFVSTTTVTQDATKRVSGGTAERLSEQLSKKWYEQHRVSFELRRMGSSDEWRVRLVAAAHARATARVFERQAEAQRVRELRVADQVLPKLSADNLPRTLRSPELAGLLCVLSRGQRRVPDELPSALLRRLCRRGDAMPKELLQEVAPFPPALLMRGIVALEKQARQRWDKEALDIVLQAAALDMHVVEERPRAALPTAAAALWAAARRPFDDRLNAGRCLLVPSAALRLQVELAENVALSPDGSSFRAFAQMCAWLAHLVVTASLPQEVRKEVLGAFQKLTAACEDLGGNPENAPCDPEGLCRLAMAVALVVREERNGFGTEALQGLARVCVQRAMDEAFDWRPQQLAVLASAYAAAEVPHEGLFRKIGIAAERHTMLGNEWSSEQLLKLLHSAWQLGQLATLERLLRRLQSVNGLQKYVREVTPRDLPLLFSVLVLVEDNALSEELMRTGQRAEKLKGVSLQGIVAMLKGWPSQNPSRPSSAAFKAAVLREALSLALLKAPTASELQVLVLAAMEDTKAQAQVAGLGASRALLASLPSAESPWHDLRTSIAEVLTPFTDADAEVPRLEAACAARLLVALERNPADVRDYAAAVLAFHENALVLMPALVEVLAERLAKSRLPRSGSTDAATARQLCERLVNAALKTPARANSATRSIGDKELDGWVERLERCALEEGRSANERRLDWVEQQATKRMPQGARDALGSTWLGMLLTRSRRLVWNGGKTVKLDCPRPRGAVKRLADVAGSLLGSALRAEVDAMHLETTAEPPPSRSAPSRAPASAGSPSRVTPSSSGPAPPRGTAASATVEPRPSSVASSAPGGSPGPAPPPRPPPGALVVSGGWDKGMADTLAGTFMPSSNNHGRGVYRRVDPESEGSSRVLLYYWDERDGEEQRGWWFGPEVGGEEVWAHNAGTPNSALPPARGWRVLHSGAVDPGLTITKIEAPRSNVTGGGTGGTGTGAASNPGAQGARAGALGIAGANLRPPPPPRPRGTAGQQASRTTPAGTGGEASPAMPARPRPPTAPFVQHSAYASSVATQPTQTGTKRPRVDDARAAELRAWLEGLDDGAGAMLQYFDVLATEFDADLAQIAAAKVDGGEGKRGILGAVDQSFWETVRVEKTGHKMLFARGIAKL